MAATTSRNSKNNNTITATRRTCTTTNSATKMLLYYTVIIACITSQFLSVQAIRCHQCNSHLDEDCNTLRLNTPRGPRDDQFLKECEEKFGVQAFCRKTVVKIEVSQEQRIVRGCGWLHDRAESGNNSCFTSDNEGYKQMFCTCNTDGCNGSTALALNKWSIMAATALSVAMAAVLRRY